jgi:hypothetical protein
VSSTLKPILQLKLIRPHVQLQEVTPGDHS